MYAALTLDCIWLLLLRSLIHNVHGSSNNSATITHNVACTVHVISYASKFIERRVQLNRVAVGLVMRGIPVS